MTSYGDLEEIRPDLELLLTDVLSSVLSEEAYPVESPADGPAAPNGAGAVIGARLAIHDEADDSYLGVEVRVDAMLARLLAARMLSAGTPSQDDVLDAVGELGNIVAGNVKSLLFHTARLSLPMADPGGAVPQPDLPSAVRVAAAVLGQVAELSLVPHVAPDDHAWPPVLADHPLENQS